MADDLTNTVAWVDRARTRAVNGRMITSPTALALQEVAEEFQDEIVVAVLELGHRLRMLERAEEVRQGSGLAWMGSGGYVF